jgi:hypothetical protein
LADDVVIEQLDIEELPGADRLGGQRHVGGSGAGPVVR